MATGLQSLTATPAPAAAGLRSRQPIGRFGPGRDVDEVHPPRPEGCPPPRRSSAVFRPGVSFPSTIRRVDRLRRLRGFERVGSGGAYALGLSATRAKDLELQAAWRHVAGPAITRHAPAIALRRGVLELAISDPAWRPAIERLLPELGARLAREHPEVGVARFRLINAPSA